MSKKLYMDAVFPDETRVVLLNDRNMIEDIDRETPLIKQLKGNIYLAKIIRVEPSLQSAFINYGGDRHGFLPFSDVHPDYYNIPEEKKNDLMAVKFFSDTSDVGQASEEGMAVEAGSEDFEEENFIELDDNNDPVLGEKEDDVDEIKQDDDVDNGIERAISAEEDAKEFETKPFYEEYKKHKIENVLRE
jgi:ribonuclease E